MRWFAVIAAAAAVVVVMAGKVAQARSPHRAGRATTGHVIEHATTDRVIDTGRKGDTTGELLTWHNKVYDETDTSRSPAAQSTSSSSTSRRCRDVGLKQP